MIGAKFTAIKKTCTQENPPPKNCRDVISNHQAVNEVRGARIQNPTDALYCSAYSAIVR